MNHINQRVNARQRHARPWRGTNGYYVACGIRDCLFAASLTGIFAFLLAPLAYGLSA